MSAYRRFGSVALALLVTAACSRAPQGSVAAVSDATLATRALASQPVAPGFAGQAFASLPDRGELVAYSAGDVRHDGAYTWHRAGLSEAHALRSIVDGHLRLTTPSGELLDVQYDRHVEHGSGDWTWVGHAPGHPEQQTILTFGPHAAFGSIAQPDGLPLRLTVRNGVSWVVETDPRKVASIRNAATTPSRPDFHVPPKIHGLAPGADATGAGMPMASAPSMAQAAAATTTTVDLVLGYTAAFASDNGGASGAMTRLNFLVDVANTAYTNSGISAKVRLVKALQVNYTDASSNEDTLEKLTGYDSGSNTQTTPDPAFNALRAAREQYGADLVSMVRSYRDPENDGCGIAWLIGGGQSGVATSDSYFGYSVVSDGTDQGTDGKTYYCLDETLAHEMGHNMGAAHDADTSKGDDGTLDADEYGAYPYSFGYKTTSSTGNFYTVMAYGDTGQHLYRIFSDPRSTFCGGRACGNANNADNARTLSQTIPTIAKFRATAVAGGGDAVRSDFNGDGVADVLWNADTGANTIWRSANRNAQQAVSSLRDVRWREAGIGDFDGDGVSDILWHNAATGGSVVWRSAKSSAGLSVATVSSANWTVAGVADFNGDGRADILWRNRSSGANIIWLSGNHATAQAVTSVTDQRWIVAGVGDFSGDGKDDIFWRNTATGANTIWKSGRSSTRVAVRSVTDVRWGVAVTGDFNGDGRDDVFWRNGSTGANTIWLGGNASTPRSVNSVTDTAWHAVAAADYDGNGKADVFWRNASTGSNVIWRAAVKADPKGVASVASQSWQVGD